MAASSSSSFSTHAPLKRVGTHNGSFHYDEALGCFMIRLTRKCFGAAITRTRDPQDDKSEQWRVHAVAVSPDSFESRKPLPEQWRGLRDDDFSKMSGIPGGVVVYMSGFIGGNVTYDGALAMAKAVLKL